jgi:hypothetical protein
MSRDSDNVKWACKDCDWRGTQKMLLKAPNPFDAGDIICGCPQCKAVDNFTNICDEPGCDKEATCGWKPKGAPYRRTCHKHMGEHHWEPSPCEVETETVKRNCPPPSWMFPEEGPS